MFSKIFILLLGLGLSLSCFGAASWKCEIALTGYSETRPTAKAIDARTLSGFMKAQLSLLHYRHATNRDLENALEEIKIATYRSRADLLGGPRLKGSFVLKLEEAMVLYEQIALHPNAGEDVLAQVALNLNSPSERQKKISKEYKRLLGSTLNTVVDRSREIQKRQESAFGKPYDVRSFFHVAGAFWSPQFLIPGTVEILEKVIRYTNLNTLSEMNIAMAISDLHYSGVITSADVARLAEAIVQTGETKKLPVGNFIEKVIASSSSEIPGESELMMRVIRLNAEVADPAETLVEPHVLNDILSLIAARKREGVPIQSSDAVELAASTALAMFQVREATQ